MPQIAVSGLRDCESTPSDIPVVIPPLSVLETIAIVEGMIGYIWC